MLKVHFFILNSGSCLLTSYVPFYSIKSTYIYSGPSEKRVELMRIVYFLLTLIPHFLIISNVLLLCLQSLVVKVSIK